MKNKIFSVLIVFALCMLKTKAQPAGVPDTLAYLQTIVANKTQYIGQPLSLLLNHLQIEVKQFSPFGGIHHRKDSETSTTLGFYCPIGSNDRYRLFPALRVFWNPYLDKGTSMSLYSMFGGCWAPQVYNHYANEIVRDIDILE